MVQNRKSGYGQGDPQQAWMPASFKSPGRMFTNNLVNYAYNIGQIVYQELTDQWIIYRGNGVWDIIEDTNFDDFNGLIGNDGVEVYPALPNGTINVLGSTVANSTNALPLYFKNTSANTLTAQIQVAGALPAPDITKSGIASFASTQFNVDSTGFVSLPGNAAAITSIDVDASSPPGTDPVLADAAGQILMTGAQVAAGTTPNVIRTFSGFANRITHEIQRSSAQSVSTVGANGVCHFNSTQFDVDSDGFVTFDASLGLQYAKWVVNPTPGLGTQTTIAAAVAAASAGDIIFVYQGTYTENFTAKAGVAITAWNDANGNGNVTIKGKVSYTDAGIVGFSNITFETNGDYAFEATGTNSNNIYFNNCSFVAADFTIVNWTNTNNTPASNIFFYNCSFDIAANSVAYFNIAAGSMGSATAFSLVDCYFYNQGVFTPSPTTISSGVATFYNCQVADMSIITSADGGVIAVNSFFTNDAIDQTIITHEGSGSTTLIGCYFSSGTAIALIANGGAFIPISNCVVNSENAVAISGTGGCVYSGINFGNFAVGSQIIDTPTQSVYNGGTFTPVLEFGGASVGITYTVQAAQYLRVDNICHFYIDIELSNKGSSTGVVTISGLPFASRNAHTTAIPCIVFNVTAPANTTYFHAAIPTTSTSINIISDQAATGAFAQLQDTNFANDTIIRIQGSYFI